MAAVLGNLVIGLVALAWGGRVPAADSGAPAEAAPTSGRFEIPSAARPLVWAAAFLSGFLSMAYEVVWSRILIFAFHSTVYSLTLILSTFLAGLAIGSRLFAALEKRAHPLRLLAAALILAGLTALLLAPVSTRSADVIQAVSARVTGVTFLGTAALCAALVILVPATLMGLVLPVAMRLLVDDLARAGRRIGGAYLVNTVGSVAGSVVAGFVLIPLLGLKGALLLLGAAQVALGWAFLAHAELSARRRLQVLGGSGTALLAGFIGAALLLRGPSPFDPIPGDGVVLEAHRDGVAASTSVVRYPEGGRGLRIDGFEASSDIVAGGRGTCR